MIFSEEFEASEQRGGQWTAPGDRDLDVNIQDIIDTWKIITTALTTEYVSQSMSQVISQL